jgi:hypothetical protein
MLCKKVKACPIEFAIIARSYYCVGFEPDQETEKLYIVLAKLQRFSDSQSLHGYGSIFALRALRLLQLRSHTVLFPRFLTRMLVNTIAVPCQKAGTNDVL